jgi:hypothetical protein
MPCVVFIVVVAIFGRLSPTNGGARSDEECPDDGSGTLVAVLRCLPASSFFHLVLFSLCDLLRRCWRSGFLGDVESSECRVDERIDSEWTGIVIVGVVASDRVDEVPFGYSAPTFASPAPLTPASGSPSSALDLPNSSA